MFHTNLWGKSGCKYCHSWSFDRTIEGNPGRFISQWMFHARTSWCNFLDTDIQSLLSIKKIQEEYVKKCDGDEYYWYSDDTVISCASYINWVRPQLCAWVATHLTDEVLQFSHKEPNSFKVSQRAQWITVFSKLCCIQTTKKKLKNIKNTIHLKTSILSEY